MTENPYQDVINWLRSPEGEKWSEERMRTAAVALLNLSPAEIRFWNLNRYGNWQGPLFMGGMFSVKEDA